MQSVINGVHFHAKHMYAHYGSHEDTEHYAITAVYSPGAAKLSNRAVSIESPLDRTDSWIYLPTWMRLA